MISIENLTQSLQEADTTEMVEYTPPRNDLGIREGYEPLVGLGLVMGVFALAYFGGKAYRSIKNLISR